MPFDIDFTYQSQKQILLCALTAILMLLGGRICLAVSPPIFRLLFWSWLLYNVMTIVPRFNRWKWTLPVSWVILIAAHHALADPMARFIGAGHPKWAPRVGDRLFDVLHYHFSAVQDTLLATGQSFFAAVWPGPAESLISLAVGSLIWLMLPPIRRSTLRASSNRFYKAVDLILGEMPGRLAGYVRTEIGLAAAQFFIWVAAWQLLGFRYPLFLAFLSAAGYWTPYFGAPLAAMFALFFTTNVRDLPWQLAGILIVLALGWLVKNHFWEAPLNAHRPAMASGVVLLLCLSGLGLAGLWGSLFTVPLFLLSLHFAALLQILFSLLRR